ncbi:MAG TPA: carbonate dehydratase [Candidatus Ozemobacteraceae bacterium]|nr:carbonate dehydratase [Candidatus Ozemobacteraceae bacterium]
MKHLKLLFENNTHWVKKVERETPGFFRKLSAIHEPKYLWIGCSDSRVPANEIVGLLPGELFVHRNIANQVIHTDINCLSVIQYAVDNLKIEHVIVCGHYGCGGVRAALENKYHGFIDNWLRNLQEIIRIKRASLERVKRHTGRLDLLSELNVVRQALNVGDTTIVQDAWRRKQPLTVHGWIYSLKNGLLKDLGISVSSIAELQKLESRYFSEG